MFNFINSKLDLYIIPTKHGSMKDIFDLDKKKPYNVVKNKKN